MYQATLKVRGHENYIDSKMLSIDFNLYAVLTTEASLAAESGVATPAGITLSLY